MMLTYLVHLVWTILFCCPVRTKAEERAGARPQFKRVCYNGAWSYSLYDGDSFTSCDVDPFLCTHIIFAFGEVAGNSVADSSVLDRGKYMQLMELRKKNPRLKILLAIGGYSANQTLFSNIASSGYNMKMFAMNTVGFLRREEFDGIDVDWEYPGDVARGGTPEDTVRFTQLLRVMYEEFESESSRTGLERLILTAAIGASKHLFGYYEIPSIARYVDFINLMTYDYHRFSMSTSYVDNHSPLYARRNQVYTTETLNQDWAVTYLLQKDLPSEKLVLGIPAYGTSYTLEIVGVTEPGAPANGPGRSGKLSQGILAYYEICDFIRNGNWTRKWQREQLVPYAYRGDQWVGYDDIESVTYKGLYIKAQRLGGFMMWRIDLDDYRNRCGDGSFPLLNTLRTVLEQPTVTGRPTTTPSLGSLHCKNGLLLRHPNTCTKYVQCWWNTPVVVSCPAGLYFNSRIKACDWPRNVPECQEP